MSVARILFLAKYRVPHACFALQWDHNLVGVDYTIVASPVPKEELWPVFHKYGIDTTNFQYINDDVIYQKYPQVNNWVFKDDYRGWWLRQQAIKLSYLDTIAEDVMLMHDCDTFMIEPYQCYKDNKLNFMALLNTTQGSYNGVFESITGLPKKTEHCFVTELVPVKNDHWRKLRQHLEQRWPGKHWLDAIIEAVPGMPTVPPWGDGNIIKWFSEYEFLGNWAVHCDTVEFTEQRRFEYDSLDKLKDLDPSKFNAVCDAIPDLSLSMQMNWDTFEIPDFDKNLSLVKNLAT